MLVQFVAARQGRLAVVSGPVHAAPGSISGQVVGVSGGSDVCVRLFDGPGGTEIVQTPQVCTDVDGNFEFFDVPEGAFWVELDDQTNTYAALGEPAVVTDGSVSVVYLDATAGPALTGRVVDENGQPARGLVHVYDNICCISYGLIDETGRYLVRLQESSANVLFDGYGLTDEWYADAPSKASSTPVIIGSGITVVDATLAAPAHVIEGRVTNLIGAGVAGATVTITSTTNGNDRATTTTDASGFYSIPAPPQSHRVGVTAGGYNAQWFNGQPGELLADVVTVTNSDVNANFNMTSDDTASVFGRVSDEFGYGINIPGGCVTVWDTSDEYVAGPSCPDSTGYFRINATLSPDTTYRFDAAAIGYVSQSQTRYLQRGIPTELRFEMSRSYETTTVSGSIRDSVGALIPDACIQLFDYFGGSAGPLASQCVDTNGDYEFTGVFAGTYRVEITAAGYVTLNSTKEVSTATTPVDLDFVMTAPTVPERVTGLSVSPSVGRVGVFWAPPADGGTPITDYDLQMSIDNGPWINVDNTVFTSPSFNVTGLTDFVGHRFRVRAGNVLGEGPYSATISALPGNPTATVPDRVGGLVATPGVGTVDLTWVAPPNGGAPIIDFDVQMSVAGDPWVTIDNTTLTGTSLTATGLTDLVSHRFRVAPPTRLVKVNGHCRSPSYPRDPSTTVPARVGGLVATQVGNFYEVDLTWVAPPNGGAPIIDYDVQISIGGDPWRSVDNPGLLTSTTFRVGVPFPTQPSRFRVRAGNALGEGPWSPASSPITVG